MIEEERNSAKDELKRADHLIYVSLKYTRTVDVIESIIYRFISAQEMIIDEILSWMEKKKKISNVDFSKPYRIKSEWVRGKFKKDKKFLEFLDLHDFYIRIMKLKHLKREEFRKNVRMIAIKPDGSTVVEVGVEDLKEYYKKVCSLVAHIEKIIK